MTVAASTELRVVNPATLELVATVAISGKGEIAGRLAAARAAQERWAAAPVSDRRVLLERVAALVLEWADEIDSKHGLYELSNVRFVDRDRGRVPVPWWYPYDGRAADAFRGSLAALYERNLARRARGAWRVRRDLLVLARRCRR